MILKFKIRRNNRVKWQPFLGIKEAISNLRKHNNFYLTLALGLIILTITIFTPSYYILNNYAHYSSNAAHKLPHTNRPSNTPAKINHSSSKTTSTSTTNQTKPTFAPQTIAKNQSSPVSSVSNAGLTANSSDNISSTVFFGSIDTMKDSRDTDFPTSNQMTEIQIQQEVNIIAAQKANYITDDAFYDYPAYMALWANTIHALGKSVWFRPHFNCWELDNGCSAQMTPAEYLSSLTNFINSNYVIFKSGDIFDPCSEPEDSNYWQNTFGSNWSWQNAPNSGTDTYNNFMIDVSQTAQTTLQVHGVYGVITNIRSTNSWWPQNPYSLYPSTIKTLGYVTYDSYPESNTTDPTIAVASRIAELNSIIKYNPGIPIVLGEFGYSNDVDVDDAVQASVLEAEINAIIPYKQIVGLNYWVGAGGSGYGGFTNIFTGARGNWQARPGAAVIANYFSQKIN